MRTTRTLTLRRLIGGVLLTGATAFGAAAVWWGHGPGIGWQQALAVLVLISLGDLAEVALRLGAHRVRFSSGEAMMLLAYVIATPPSAVVLAALVLAAVEAIRRERAAVKAAFNVASATCAAVAGAIVVAAGGAQAGAPRDWPVLALAGAVVVAVQGLLVSAAVAHSTSGRTWATFQKGQVHRLALWAANVALALGALGAWRWNRSMLVALALLAVSGSGLMARLLRTRDELDGLRRLDLATRTLPGLDETLVLTSVCNQTRGLLGIDTAEIVLLGPAHSRGPGLVFAVTSDEPAVRRIPTAIDVDDVLRAAGPGVTTRVEEGRTVASASLRAGNSHVGVLRVTLQGTRTQGADLHLLAALATTAGGAVLNARMFAEQQRHAEELRATAARDYEQARHDPLTGLGNRTGLLEAGDALLGRSTPGIGLLLLDLNHFKEVNDTLGHAAGDELLRRVARRLQDHCGEDNYLARLGGDEFALLVGAATDPDALEDIGLRLLDRLREPIMVDGLRLTAEASGGAVWVSPEGTTMEELLRCADVAMYRAKRTNQPLVRYDGRRDDGEVERLEVLAAVQAALGRGEIVVHYQPKVDLVTGAPVGLEALCRWQHPEQGLLPPARFMPVVEHSSVINELTQFVLRTACAEVARLSRSGWPLSVAVNVSPRCLLDAAFAGEVERTLHVTGLAPDQLTLEITETLALVELDTVERVLAELRSLGVRLSLDDFGTGYSSLTFLQRVDVHEVKIDRSFVSLMQEQPGARAIVEATIQLAHRLGLVSVAEGVETPEQLEALRKAGCDQVQGFLFARPMPFTALESWLPGAAAMLHGNVIPFPRGEEIGEVTA